MSLIAEPVIQFGDNLDVDSAMTFSAGITLASKGNALDFANIVVNPTMTFSAGITLASKGTALDFANIVVNPTMTFSAGKSRVSKGTAMAFSGGGSGSSESNAVIPTQTWIG